jgi:FlaA1/EpsC-like NDP-sugar epimerase
MQFGSTTQMSVEGAQAESNVPTSSSVRVPPTIHPLIADIRDRPRLDAIFQRYAPHIVFHAAAHKHVPLMECNLEEAVSNNIAGTKCLIEAAEASGVERFVLISTDKAVNPISNMGVTKRVAEMLIEKTADRNRGIFVAVRFGNVLDSRGSVVGIFRQQIARGGPVTVTHRDMRRYFMTIPEAVQLVMQAAAIGKGGEIFVLDMGDPVAIEDLAHDMIRLSGLEVWRDIDIEYCGIRPGEKLFEELFADSESYERTKHEKIFVSSNGPYDSERLTKLDTAIDDLIAAAERGETSDVRRLLEEIVPGYQALE